MGDRPGADRVAQGADGRVDHRTADGRLQSADAELHVRIEPNEQQPATIHVSGRRTRSASSAGLFVLWSQGDSNGVTLSSDGPRIVIDVLWNRDANGGELS